MVPPFAEEMMKSRQQFTQTAHSLNARGLICAIIDVRGTGDASDELADVTWNDWSDDVAQAHAALTQYGPVSGIGLRLGALLLADACAAHTLPLQRAVLWEPQFSGKTAIKQFMRIAAVSAQMQGKAGDAPATPQGGQEVGGYWVSDALERSIAAVTLPEKPLAPHVHIVRITPEENASVPPGWNAPIETLRTYGANVDVSALTAPAFWSTTEITTNYVLTQRLLAWWTP
jgi:uncharacterized protein